MSRVLLLSLVLLLVSCGAPIAQSEKFSYSYALQENGCRTGSHRFPNLMLMCSALKDDTLNQGCARTERKILFEQQCSGQFEH